MEELIEKRLKKAKIFRIVIWVLLGIFAVSLAVAIIAELIPLVIVSILAFYACFVCFIIYMTRFRICAKNQKWLAEKGLSDAAKDIHPEELTFPKSGICCGQRAIFSRKFCLIIPYSEIAWAYMYEHSVNGIPVERYAILFTKDRMKNSIPVKADECMLLIGKYIAENAPDAILGYGKEQKKKFDTMY